MRLLAVGRREVGVRLEVVEIGLADDRTPFHRVVVLGLRQRVGAAGRAERAAGEIGSFRCAQQVGVAPGTVALCVGGAGDPAGEVAAVTEVERHRVVRLSRHLPDGQLEFPPAGGHRDEVLVLETQRPGGGGTDQGGVVPGQLGHRVRQFLEPAVVGEATVVNRRGTPEDDFQIVARGERLGRVAGGPHRRRPILGGDGGNIGRRCGAAVQQAVVQHLAPGDFEPGERDGERQRHRVDRHGLLRFGVLSLAVRDRFCFRLGLRRGPDGGRLVAVLLERQAEDPGPGLANQIAAVPGLAQSRKGQHLDKALRAVERLDQGLHDARRAIGGAGVAPALEEVGERHVPAREATRFVPVGADVDDGARAAQVLEGRCEVEVGGSAVGGVGAQDQKTVDRAFVDRRRQSGQVPFARTAAVGCPVVRHRRAGVAERRVQGVHGGVDSRRLTVAGDDQAGAAVGDQVLRQRVDPGVVDVRGRRAAVKRQFQAVSRERAAEPGDEGGDPAALHPQAVIRVRRRDRVDAVDGIVPQRAAAAFFVHAPRPRVAAQVANTVTLGAEEVGVQGQQDLRAVQVVERVNMLTGGERRPPIGVLFAYRFPGHPARLWIAVEQRVLEPNQGGRRGWLGEDGEAGAVGRGAEVAFGPGGHEVVPGGRLVAESHGLRAVRVVQVEHRGLGPHARRALRERMKLVTFDLGRAPLVTLHQQAERAAAERHRGGVGQRHAGDHSLRGVDVWDDVFDRAADDVAAGQAGERRRPAQHGERAAPADAVPQKLGRRFRSTLRKLSFEEGDRRGIALKLLQATPVGSLRPLAVARAHR